VIAAISGYGQPEDRARSKAAGFDEHLVKPVDPERLRALLRQPERSSGS
jgi:CheY-like chemotaxis protein